ncbi:unnamed protein product, partial [Ectocarpus sp. 4 AP-2014]
DLRLREAERELAAARRLLREAGAERELLHRRLEEGRQEMEEWLQGCAQAEGGLPGHPQYLKGIAKGREALLQERELREAAESLHAQLRAAMDEQLELDAEALERMNGLTRQARKEQEETTREKDRLQGCVVELERGKRKTEGALSVAQEELEEACRDLEDASRRLARSRRDHGAA